MFLMLGCLAGGMSQEPGEVGEVRVKSSGAVSPTSRVTTGQGEVCRYRSDRVMMVVFNILLIILLF